MLRETRAERPAVALDEHLEAPPRQRRREHHPRQARPAVRRPDQHHRKRPVIPGGPVQVTEQHHAIWHLHRDIAPQHVPHPGRTKTEHAVHRHVSDTRQRIHQPASTATVTDPDRKLPRATKDPGAVLGHNRSLELN